MTVADFSNDSALWGFSYQDLYQRLDQARYTPPLEGSAFNYGFNSNYLQRVISYWRNQFDWQKQVKILNQYPHYKTTIEGEFSSELHMLFSCVWANPFH